MKATQFSISALIFVVLMVFGAMHGKAQDEHSQQNYHPGIPYSISDIENINLTNGNLMLNFNFGSVKGRGSAMSALTLKYNSKLYESETETALDSSGQQATQLFLRQSDEGGWKYDDDYRLKLISRNDGQDHPIQISDSCGKPNYKSVYVWKLMMYFPDGSQHEFRPTGYSDKSQDVLGSLQTGDGYFNVDTSGHVADLLYSSVVGTCPNYQTQLVGWQDPNPKMTYYSTDGTFMRLEIPNGQNALFPSKWTVFMPDGSRVVSDVDSNGNPIPQKIYDKNANYVTRGSVTLPDGTTAGGHIDQFGRYVARKAISSMEDDIYKLGPNGQLLTWKVKWKYITITRQYTTSGAGDGIGRGGTSTQVLRSQPKVVDEIDLPDQLGGQKYLFTYNALDGQVPWDPNNPVYSPGWGELLSITLPSGADANYSYAFPLASGTDTLLPLLGKISGKSLTYDAEYDGATSQVAENWVYSIHSNNTIVTGPDGETSQQLFYSTDSDGDLSGRVYKEIKPNGTIVERIWKNNKVGGCPSYGCGSMRRLNTYVKTEFTTVPDNAGNPSLTAIKDFDYDKNGNVSKVTDYDFVSYSSLPRDSGGFVSGIPGGISPARITENAYYNQTEDASNNTANSAASYWNTTAPNVRTAIASSTVKKGDGTPVSRSEFNYFDVNTTANLTSTLTWDSYKNGSFQPYSAPLTGANSVSATIAYDQYGNPTLTTDPKGIQTQLTYGAISGPNGNVTDLYPTQTVSAYGTAIARTSTAVYDFYTGLTTSSTDVDNSLTNATQYDDLGRPVKVITASGDATYESWTTTEYHDADRYVVVRSDLATKGDGKKVATQFYDQLGRVRLSKTLEDPSQSATNETDGIKVQTRYAVTNSGGTGYTYQLASNPYRSSTSSGASGEMTMGWTRSKAINTGRHSEVETFSGTSLPAPWGSSTSSTGVVTTDLDADRTLVTDQASKQRISKANGLGQLINVWEVKSSDSDTESISFPSQSLSAGLKTTYTYDTLNNLTTVNQGSQTRTFTYSSLSRLLSAANPESGTISYVYDSNGNLTTKTDARSITTTYAYDYLNRVTSRSYSGESGYTTPTVNYTYDAQTHAKGKLTKVSTGTGANTSTTEYVTFDILGRVTASKQTTDGGDTGGYTTGYTYTLAGALDTETYPSTRVVKNELNNDGSLSMVESKKNSSSGYWSYANSFTYNPAGAVTSMQLGNGHWESTTFNSRLQPTRIALGTTPGALDKLQLDFGYGTTANNGNVQTQTITVPTVGINTGFAAVQAYTYDSLNRLKDATENVTPIGGSASQSWKQTFTYDRYGNRRFDEANTTMPSSFANQAVSDPTVSTTTNRLTSSGYSYDSAGNTTASANGQSFTYDGENKQVQVNSGATILGQYYYDGDGKRVKKVVPGTGETTIFVYDAAGKEIAEYSTIVASTNDAKVNYLTNDHLGSPRINTDQNGAIIARHDYHPFGEEIDGTGGRTTGLNYGDDTVRKQFTGYEMDTETDLDYAKARMYSNNLGRFTETDPISISKEHPSNPQKWNLYVYVVNNPLNLTDPDGLKPKRTVDVYIMIDEDSTDRAAWTKLRKEARHRGVIVNIFRVGDGTATSKNFLKSIKAGGRDVVFVGHSVPTEESHKQNKGIGIEFQSSANGAVRDVITDRKSLSQGYGNQTVDGVSARAANIAVFSCNFGQAFDKLGSTNGTNFIYTNNGELGGTNVPAQANAAFGITRAFVNGLGGEAARQAAQAGFDSARGPEDNDGDRIDLRILRPNP
jgi:RHS repeat-associated protein